MTIDEAKKKIYKYCEKPADRFDGSALIVSVNSLENYKNLRTDLEVMAGGLQVSTLAEGGDRLPPVDGIWSAIDDMRIDDECLLVYGLDMLARFYGETKLRQVLTAAGGKSCRRKTIFLVLGAQNLLRAAAENPKTKKNYALVDDAPEEAQMSFRFIDPKLELPASEQVSGIKIALQYMENAYVNKELQVKTGWRAADFPNSLYAISELSGPDCACKIDKDLSKIPENYGSEERWSYLLRLLRGSHSVKAAAELELSSGEPQSLFQDWESWSAEQRWLYLLTLKMYECKEKNLAQAAAQSAEPDDLVQNLYRGILEVDWRSKDFAERYKQRKKLLRAVKGDAAAAHDFCQYSQIRGADRIHYLTDNTLEERRAIICCLDGYTGTRDTLLGILHEVYPALEKYMSDYEFAEPFLTDYFSRYKMCKLTNRIDEAFMQTVNEQAEKREYSMLLRHRSAEFDKVDKTGSCLYFMDAMGVEYLGYIRQRCADMGLMLNISTAYCNLPSITSCNKEFLDGFDPNAVYSVKELDEIKHEGKNDYDFRKVAQPIHLCRELEIIDEVLEQARQRLAQDEYRKVILISDHGASRLVVIRRSELKYEVESKGEHGGRCCPYVAGMEEIPHAIQENGYYVLASYDSFKGSRAPSVETHGGATLEEVTIPIIELMKKPAKVEITIKEKTVKMSPGKPVTFTIFSKTPMEHLSVRIGELTASGTTDDKQNFTFKVSGIKKQGTYSADVYSGDTLLAKELRLIVEGGMKVKGRGLF